MARSKQDKLAFPDQLREREGELVRTRRQNGRPQTVESTAHQTVKAASAEPSNTLGLALSGGGIRSATLSLGVLQALARHRLLRHVDYLSTVSGGGYIGVFLGALFTRWNRVGDAPRIATQAEHAEPPCDWDRVEQALEQNSGHPIAWLRENGRHLAPNGAGDLLLAIAIAVRNLFAVHVVLGTLVLALALSLTGVRLGLVALVDKLSQHMQPLLPIVRHALHAPAIWWSPTVLFSAFAFIFLVVPLGIAYWLVPSSERGDKKHRDTPPQVYAIYALAFFSSAYLTLAYSAPLSGVNALAAIMPPLPGTELDSIEHQLLAFSVLLVAALSYTAFRYATAQSASPAVMPTAKPTPRTEEIRTELTQGLRTALTATAVLFGIGLVDSLAQSLYAIVHDQGVSGVLRWVAAGFSSVAALATLVQRVSGLVSEKTSGRLRLPMQLLTAVAGFTLLFVMVLGVATAGHALTWQSDSVLAAPETPRALKYQVTSEGGPNATVLEPQPTPLAACLRPAVPGASGDASDRASNLTLCTPTKVNGWLFGCALFLAWFFTCLFRRQYSFVNRSSLSALYGIRLARAYLGASNAKRQEPQNQALTKLLPGDELSLCDFKPHQHGGPLTLINVTVNETMAGRSQVQQRDRKGMGMALGPAGVSVGVRHHATWHKCDDATPLGLVPVQSPQSEAAFQVFCLPDVKPAPQQTVTAAIKPHWPSMGRWMAISGAAVSTGLGARTSVGLSLLIGLFNFRLGHWWRSGVDPAWRNHVRSKSGMKVNDQLGKARALLPVQMHLLDELFARFAGTSDADWYLTDGGHFENSGAYELIRRRLRVIMVCDNGADPDRSFDDLGNLVRKARLDFGAHIRFLDRAELATANNKQLDQVVGTLADLGFCGQLAAAIDASTTGKSREEVAQARLDSPEGPASPDDKRRPKRYAALAEITYDDESPEQRHWLLWLRPAVLGHEPFDILNYQVANCTFPQQSTGDQFFDEAQWESYRRLGELMACHVFSGLGPIGEVGSWDPFSGIEPAHHGCSRANGSVSSV